jgi:DNA-binding transcriptional regulator YhcF (GntR family)
MKDLIRIDLASNRPKYQQILEAVIASIEQGRLARGQQLPSISELADWQQIAKVTVAKAYEELRQRGVVLSRQGKGFYVASTEVRNPMNLFLLFDTLNAYKETLYYALKEALPEGTQLHLFFHHYDRQLFQSLIENNLGQYTYYVVMPHFNEDVSEVVGRIPKDKLMVIDKAVARLEGDYAAVYQNFSEDIFSSLVSGLDLLKRYRRLTLVLSNGNFQFVPEDIVAGFKRFGKTNGFVCKVAKSFSPDLVKAGEAYLLFADRDLIAFIRHVREQGWELGRDVGLISYDDTPMKEILEGGITVISTDFEQMGRTAGWLINERRKEKLANPARLIRRKTL